MAKDLDNRVTSIRFRVTEEEKEILKQGSRCDERLLSDFLRYHMLRHSKKLIIETNSLEAYKFDMSAKVMEALNNQEKIFNEVEAGK